MNPITFYMVLGFIVASCCFGLFSISSESKAQISTMQSEIKQLKEDKRYNDLQENMSRHREDFNRRQQSYKTGRMNY